MTFEKTHNHTDEEHKIECEEIYQKIMVATNNHCATSIMMALCRSMFDCLMAPYPEHMSKEEVIAALGDVNTLIINNLAITFAKVEKELKNESNNSAKH